jgi:hypothetical protein
MWIAVQDFSEARWNIAHTLRIRANCRQTRMAGRNTPFPQRFHAVLIRRATCERYLHLSGVGS